jgi:vitamin B12 transporter
VNQSCRYPLALCAAVAVVSATAVQAADPADQPPVIVTATRTAQTVDSSLASVTVITREDIERTQAKTVPELLRGIPGVDLTTQGGPGKLTSVFLRGTNSGHVLVLIDGNRIGAATNGGISWEFLPLSEIERIEIVRGPRSTLYGSDAIGGVIQIFTRKGSGPAQPRASVTAGSYHTWETAAGVSGASGDTRYNVSASRFATGGFNARQPVVEFGSPLNEPDRDGYRNSALSFSLDHRLAGHTEVGLHGLRATGHADYDSSGNNRDRFAQEAAGVRLGFRPLSSWSSRFNLGHGLDDRRSSRVGGGTATPTRFSTTKQTFSWQNDFSLTPQQLLTLGYDRLEDRVASTTAYTVNRRETHGLFGQYQVRFGAHDLNLGYRDEDNEQFGRHRTGTLGWGHALTDNLRLVASHGTAFRAPTFNDLYFPGFSNPNLKPEESRSTEIGLRGKALPLAWAVHAYRTDISNLIALNSSFIPQNINKARIDGVELELTTRAGDWRLASNLGYTDPRNVDTDKLLPRRSRQSARLQADRLAGAHEYGIELLAQGPRYDNTANTIRLGGYGVLNARWQYRMSRDWRLQARLENILDKTYETVASYNTPGRSAYLTLSWQPGPK